ncbi:uncharacterized protein CG45076-like isoform X4 [Condylostylus longicornis]|uniref:uncharacterized protein CG45076-like isoform X4 n=1 Tax=Condylostylus longicornis TaxID=2530218 RepID=UPI00244DE185|nr:uncharacterized protein CG45076-like isoform X4 [Condylostylus longicornis]
MVYTSDYYTTRSYSSRPVVSSYTVSYPVSSYSTGKSTVYTASSYPLSSYTSRVIPYYSSRVYTSPVRVITTPISTYSSRVYRSPSPVRTITTTRIVRSPSPVRVISTPITYTRVISSPVRVISSPIRYFSYPTYRPYIASPYIDTEISPRISLRTTPATLAREYDRILNKVRPRYGYRPLDEYLNSEAFINFDSETRRIRNDAHSVLREIHSKVPHRARSITPYYTIDDAPNSLSGLKSYVSRITDPTRHIIREVRSMSLIPESPRKYMGPSHLAAIRICDGVPYTRRNPFYDADQVRNDINLLSYYLKNRRAANEKQIKSEDKVEAVSSQDVKIIAE